MIRELQDFYAGERDHCGLQQRRPEKATRRRVIFQNTSAGQYLKC